MIKSIFTREFKEEVLSCLVQDKQFLREAIPVLRPEFFEDSMLASALDEIFASFRDTGQSPSKVGLLNGIVNRMASEYRTKDKSQEQQLLITPATVLVERIFRIPDMPRDDVKKKFLSYCRTRAMQLTIVDLHNKLETGEIDHDAVISTVRSTYQRSHQVVDEGIDFFTSIGDLPADLIAMKKKTVTTGFPSLDADMDSGGPTPGNLVAYMGRAKGGKSMTLINTGHANLIRSRNIMHFTCELTGPMTRKRYASRISNIPMDEMERRVTEVMERVAGFNARHHGKLFIKYYQTGSATVDHLRGYLYQLEGSYNFKPDLIIVDYGDILRPAEGNKNKSTEERFAQKTVFEELRGLAGEFGCAVFTATQTNRNAFDKNVVELDDVGEAYAKVQVADHIISFCQTKEEYDRCRARLHYAGTREGRPGRIIQLRTNWPVCAMSEISDKYEMHKDDEWRTL